MRKLQKQGKSKITRKIFTGALITGLITGLTLLSGCKTSNNIPNQFKNKQPIVDNMEKQEEKKLDYKIVPKKIKQKEEKKEEKKEELPKKIKLEREEALPSQLKGPLPFGQKKPHLTKEPVY